MHKRLSWSLRELDAVPKNGFRVFSTFACAGGSTMGYKRAGFEVVGANDIDEEMAKIYRANHKPGSYFLGSIRDLVSRFRDEGVLDALQGLDILDGSPPCTPFSLATGTKRGKDWGKAKKFREGQSVQVLDDLFFTYLELVDVLRPRVFVAENVMGLFAGRAKGYAKQILQEARKLGYSVQVLKLNAISHGVPQRRERLFFVGRRDSPARSLRLRSVSRVLTVRDAWSDLKPSKDRPGTPLSKDMAELWRTALDRRGKFGLTKCFSQHRLRWNEPSNTITATVACSSHPAEPRRLSAQELFRLGSFPDDFWLPQSASASLAQYVVGMSVPPFMVEDLSTAIAEQWL